METKKEINSRKVRILTIDGGGIRGIIPAVILNELEIRLQKKTNNPYSTLSDYFDMIAGTSTGGILTCLYALPPSPNSKLTSRYLAERAVEFYMEKGADIFEKPFMCKTKNLFYNELYPAKGLENALDEVFGSVLLSETKIPILVPAYDIERRKTIFFTARAAERSDLRDFYLKDVARATSAAPTYFEVAKVNSKGDVPFYLIDGGMFANDPTMCVLSEVGKMKFFHEHSPSFHELFILSIGTGMVKEKYNYEKVKNWGVLGWARPVIDIMMSSSAEVVNYQVSKIMEVYSKKRQAVININAKNDNDEVFDVEEVCEDNYIRIMPELGKASSKMDDASSTNLMELKNAGLIYIEEHSEQLDDLVNKLIKYGDLETRII